MLQLPFNKVCTYFKNIFLGHSMFENVYRQVHVSPMRKKLKQNANKTSTSCDPLSDHEPFKYVI